MRNVFVGPNGIRAGWRLLIFVAIIAAEVVLLLGIARVAHLPLHPPGGKGKITAISPGMMVVGEAVMFGLVLLAAFIMSKIEKRRMGLYGIPLREAFGKKFWMGAAVGLGGISVVLLLIALCGGGVHFGRIAALTPALIGSFFLYLLLFLLVGFSEEFTFRGYAQYTLTTGMYFWPAAILTSVFFAYVHTGNHGESPAGIAQVFLFAVVFCFALQRTGNLWFGIGYHMAWDWGQTFFYGVPDSGLQSSSNLLHVTLTGPAWLSGGSVGPEGSVFTALQLLLVAAFVAWRYPRNRYETGTAPAAAVATA